MAQSVTNLDARLLRTAQTLVRHPGELTVRYLQGPRKPYIGPIAFFLLANVLFVAMEALTKSNVFATHLAQHLSAQPWSGWIGPFVAHVAYSLHFHAFMLLSLCVLLGVLAIDMWFGGPGLASRLFDNALALIHLVVCALWLYVASGPVYGARGAMRVVKALAVTFGAVLTFLGYRFALLWITLYAT